MSGVLGWILILAAIVAFIWFALWFSRKLNEERAERAEREFQKQRKKEIEWQIRQDIIDQGYAKKAADKILRERGQTP